VRILDIWEQWRREAMVQVDLPQLAIDVECRLNPVWPMPGLVSTLEGLARMGMNLGIVSNAQVFTPCLFPALAGKSLEAFGVPAAHCVWSWVKREAKPSTRLYGEALERLGHPDPATCLYVGNDMRNDIAPAKAVGMQTALFAGDRRSLRWRKGDPLVGETLPDMVITRLTHLLECV
jgi:putative hydrolase of the HAD superfamily